MSFLGSIGNIIAGSGLEEAFSTIYSDLSADKADTGHVFSRAVRGHLLVQAAIYNIICEQINLSDTEKNFLNECLSKVGKCEIDLENPLFNTIIQK